MSNKVLVEKFIQDLCAAKGKKPERETLELYRDKLSKWKLTGSQWDAALDSLLIDPDIFGFPQLSHIYPHLKAASTTAREQKPVMFLSFTAPDGRRYTIPHQPGSKPEIPEGCTDGRLAIPQELQDYSSYEPVVQPQSRAYFAEGFDLAGGKQDKLEEYYSLIPQAVFVQLRAAAKLKAELSVPELEQEPELNAEWSPF